MSVRARITLLATAVVTLVLVVAGIGLAAQQRRLLTESLDESLHQQADRIAAQAAEGARVSGLGDDDAFAQVVREPDDVVASSANVEGLGPLVPIDPPRTETVEEVPHEDSAFRVEVQPSDDVVVIVGAPTDDIEDSIETLVRSLVVGIPIVVVVLAGVLWWLVGRALRPVEAIRAEVAEIGARDLDRRVPVPPADDEVGRLARTMNDMLERVDDATRRQQRFLADASHELRSPLTRMRTELEVDLAHPDRADPAATHASVLAETIGLQRLADDLLLVARADERGGQPRSEPVDLSAVSAGRVVGDSDQLARAVGNLADNAVRHARSVVRFALAERGGQVVLTVEDDGPGVPAADRERIFERFARVDEARSARTGGTGLGLAIARDVAQQHAGTLVLAPTDGGATFVLTLPAAPR